MKNNIVVISIIAITVLLFGGIVFAMSDSSQAQVVTTSNAKASVQNEFHDFGEVGINDGKITAEYEVFNEGSEVLQFYNLTTSCSCTNARFVSGDNESPEFGMHSKSKYVYEVQPGDSVTIKAVFDPLFHGPSGVGSISRDITVDTNDASNPQLSFKMSGEVRK